MTTTAGSRTVKERDAVHGDPLVNMQKIATHWTSILGVQVTPEDVCHCMIAFKVARDTSVPQEDNLVDIEGYVDILRRVRKERDGDRPHTAHA